MICLCSRYWLDGKPIWRVEEWGYLARVYVACCLERELDRDPVQVQIRVPIKIEQKMPTLSWCFIVTDRWKSSCPEPLIKFKWKHSVQYCLPKHHSVWCIFLSYPWPGASHIFALLQNPWRGSGLSSPLSLGMRSTFAVACHCYPFIRLRWAIWRWSCKTVKGLITFVAPIAITRSQFRVQYSTNDSGWDGNVLLLANTCRAQCDVASSLVLAICTWQCNDEGLCSGSIV